ncbi:hypothetical protein [Candidatus Lokiarchaeum ossiferum]
MAGIEDELTYRLKLNAASLLSSNFEEFESEMEFFGLLYGLRSQIIHGTPNWKISNKSTTKYKKFISHFQLKGLSELYSLENPYNMRVLEYNLKLQLYQKMCKILKLLIKGDIDYKCSFKNAGFLKEFLKKYKSILR